VRRNCDSRFQIRLLDRRYGLVSPSEQARALSNEPFMIHLSVNGAHLAPFERFANCGHGVVPDAPERTMALIRDFIQRY
jgi:hypothetical protein